jgi:hypothetical protein
MALRDDFGYRVVNLAIGLGRSEDHGRRYGELTEASRRAGFELVTLQPAVAISRGDDLDAAQARIRLEVERVLREYAPAVVISPWPGDRHHGHEVVARGVRDALRDRPDPPVWWMWGLWRDLPLPTLFVSFGQDRLAEINHALDAHAGEVSRNDYRRLVEGRAMANAVLGAELIFGFGAPARGAPYAELLMEVLRREDGWWLGQCRELASPDPLETSAARRLDTWFDETSVRHCSPTA